jgi:hypothetical protein
MAVASALNDRWGAPGSSMIFLDCHAWRTGSLAVKESVFSVSAWIAAPLKTSLSKTFKSVVPAFVAMSAAAACASVPFHDVRRVKRQIEVLSSTNSYSLI